MKRLWLLLAVSAICGVASLVLARGAAAEWVTYYPSPAWYGPGEGHASGYDDNFCFDWDDNYFSKSHVAKGTIAWINTSGGVDSYETVMWYRIPDIYWVKKLYAKNTSTIGYSSTTQGYQYHFNCV